MGRCLPRRVAHAAATRCGRRRVVERGDERGQRPDVPVELGETIGWIEAFKAMTDVYCVGTGQFDGGNPLLEIEPHKFDIDPYSAGWLYSFRGTPDPNAVDASGYSRLLDLAIDKIQGKEAAMDRPPTADIGD